MEIRTLLVDGNYLLKRSYFGAKDAFTPQFGAIGGLYGFMTTLRKLIREHQINKIVVAFDGENGGIDRYRLDPEYKANRKDKSWHKKIELTDAEIKREQAKDESILKNKKRIQQYLEELFIRQIEVDEIEADDLIASYCHTNSKKEIIFLFTNDRDFIQLLESDSITILFGNMDHPTTKANFFYDFNYHYTNGLILKIIGGDVADNIKGISGIKEDALIKYFPDIKFRKLTVREICIRADEINKNRILEKKKPLKIFENLLNNVPRLRLNYELTDLARPFLNAQAVEELAQLEMPLSPENRGSKNLYKLMAEDGFLTIFNGGNFVNYLEPFYTVVMFEKQLLDSYNKVRK
jgi:5'-3' exonuclease